MNRNQNLTAAGIAVTVIVFIIGGWVQINSRISMLEVQVRNDHEMFMSQSKKIDEINSKIDDIKNDLVEIRGDMKLKQNRFKNDGYGEEVEKN